MGGQGSGRPTNEETIIRSLNDPKLSSIVNPKNALVIPNFSGDHQKGFTSKTPLKDTDLANKKYVDDSIGSTTYAKLNGSNFSNTGFTGGILATGTTLNYTLPSGSGKRLMWIPNKYAFRAGGVTGTQWDDANIGNYSFATGVNNKASGYSSAGFGGSNIISGSSAVCFGSSNTASGSSAVCFGQSNLASGDYATVFGNGNIASGDYSTAFGSGNIASSSFATVFGSGSTASGLGSFASGYGVVASGDYATAFGDSITNDEGSSFKVGYGQINFKINSGGIFIPVIKSGATQAGAGASVNEVWKTSGHSTLPDNVIMIGV